MLASLNASAPAIADTLGIKRFWRKTPELSGYELARSILGKDFITPEEVMKSREGVVYTDEQLSRFSSTLPSRKALKWCYDNEHMLVAGPSRPLSLLEIRDLKSDDFFAKGGGWYADKAFAHADKVGSGWITIRKRPVPWSHSKGWGAQQALLSRAETVPHAASAAWGVTTFRAVHDIHLLTGIHVRTSSLESDGFHVYIGDFGRGDGGLCVYFQKDDYRYEGLGVISSLKQGYLAA